MIGNPNQRHIQLSHFEHLAVIAESLGVGRRLFRFVQVRAPNVTQGHHIDVSGLDEVAHIVPAALAAADQADLEAVIRAVYTGVRKSSGCSRTAQKGSTGNSIFRHTHMVA